SDVTFCGRRIRIIQSVRCWRRWTVAGFWPAGQHFFLPRIGSEFLIGATPFGGGAGRRSGTLLVVETGTLRRSKWGGAVLGRGVSGAGFAMPSPAGGGPVLVAGRRPSHSLAKELPPRPLSHQGEEPCRN